MMIQTEREIEGGLKMCIHFVVCTHHLRHCFHPTFGSFAVQVHLLILNGTHGILCYFVIYEV